MINQFKWNNYIYFKDDSGYFKKRQFKSGEEITEESFKRAYLNYLKFKKKVKKFNQEQIIKLKETVKSLDKTSNKKVLDLFCGVGGLSLGFDKAGFEVVLAIDKDFSACQTYSFNFNKTAVLCLDLTDFEAKPNILMEKLGIGNLNFDIIIGSPPCQGFSYISRAKIRSLIKKKIWNDPELIKDEINYDEETHWFYNDPRNILYKRFLNYVNCFKPQIFLIENVPGMISYNNGKILAQIKLDFEDIGYSIQNKVLNSVDFNVPQKRKRVFFIGINCESEKTATRRNYLIQLSNTPPLDSYIDLDDKIPYPPLFKFPNGSSKYKIIKKNIITVRDAIGDLNQILTFGEEIPYNLNNNKVEYFKLIRKDMKEEKIYNFSPRDMVERDKEIFRFLEQGDKYKDLPKKITEFYNNKKSKINEEKTLQKIIKSKINECMPYGDGKNFGDKLKRLIWDQPSWTIVAHIHKDGYMYIHPEQDRTISVREAARLQSFPDYFIFKSSRTNQFKHVGNAVPPLMSQVLAHHLLDYFEVLRNQK